MKRKTILFVAIMLAIFSGNKVFSFHVYPPFITAGFDHSFIALSTTGSINTETVWGRRIGLDSEHYGVFHQEDNRIYNTDKIPNIGNCILMKKGDLNGDGMDDIIGIYQFSYFTRVFAFDGNTGKLMFEFIDKSYLTPVYYLLEIGDYNGDGKDDIAVGRQACNSLKGTFVQFVDGEGKSFRSYSAQYINPGTIGSEDPVYLMKSVDVNSDGSDDIVFIHQTPNVSIVRAFDVKKNVALYDYTIASQSVRVNIIESGDFIGNGKKDDVVFSIPPSDNTNPESTVYMLHYVPKKPILFSINTIAGSIKSIKIADLNHVPGSNDNRDDLVILTETLWENNYFWHSKITTFDFVTHNKIPTFPDVINLYRGLNIYLIETGDFDGDGIVNDVVYVRHAGNDNFNSDPYQDGSYLVMLDEYGTLQFGYASGPVYVNTPDASYTVQGYEGINYISKLDYDADGKDELAIIHHLGQSNNITGSTIRVWDPLEHKLKMDKNNSGNILKSAVILNNQITDQEFLRALKIEYNTFTDFYNAFKLDANLSLYKETFPNKIEKEQYKQGIFDFLKSSIQTYSTFSKFDVYLEGTVPVNQTNRVFNMWGARVLRIENTLNYRIKTEGKYPSEEEFKYLIKSLLSHIRLLTFVDDLDLKDYLTSWREYDCYYWNHDKEVNHAVLFVARPMYFSLRYLKDLKSTEMKKIETTLDNHIRESMNNLVNADGTYAENSFGYGFHYNYWLSHIGSYKKKYLSKYISSIDFNILSDITTNLTKAYNYYMWAIKPNETNLSSDRMIFKTDLPSYGDLSAESGNGFVGKTSPIRNIVEWPLCLKNIYNDDYPEYLLEPMIDASTDFYEQLSFAARIDGPQLVPNSLFQTFKDGGYYITRSNWAKPSTKEIIYDNNARHCEFRLSPFRVGLNPGHHHLDMLSVTMTGYNKEFFVDPQGYENICTFSELNTYFTNTYGAAFPIEIYPISKTTYFDGTAVHNTVYIGGKNQLPGFDQNVSDRENIHYDSLYNESNVNWNYASGGYSKTFGSEESHKRQLLYINTAANKTASEIDKSDYWVVIDNIMWANASELNPAVQTWNLAPWCNPTINTTDKSIRTSNFWMIPLNLNNGLTADIIDGKYAPLTNVLFSNKIARYKVTGNNTTPCTFATIILPFRDDVAPTSASVTKIPVFTTLTGSTLYTDDNVIAFRFNFVKNGETFEDRICVIKGSLNSLVKFYGDINGDLSREEITTKVTFYRNGDGASKKISSESETVDEVSLSCSIYPNPATDKINIQLSEVIDNVTLSILDISGRIVKVQNLVSSNTEIDISALAKGMYCLKLQSTNGSATMHKIIKQ